MSFPCGQQFLDCVKLPTVGFHLTVAISAWGKKLSSHVPASLLGYGVAPADEFEDPGFEVRNGDVGAVHKASIDDM